MTMQFNGPALDRAIKTKYGSVDKTIERETAALSKRHRAAIYRAIEGEPVNEELGRALVMLLQDTGEDLLGRSSGGERIRLTTQSQVYYQAIRLLGKYPAGGATRSGANKSVALCVFDWLHNQLDCTNEEFECVCRELKRTNFVEPGNDGTWIPSSLSLREITQLLEDRFAYQWPQVRRIFTSSHARRRQMAAKLRDLVKQAEALTCDPVAFFSNDEAIQMLLVDQPRQSETVRAAYAITWQIEHLLTVELLAMLQTDIVLAERSFQAITGPLFEDYDVWTKWLRARQPAPTDDIKRHFRHHVMRMRDHAQYFLSDES